MIDIELFNKYVRLTELSFNKIFVKADNRKHHTIPVCYLRSWQENPHDKKGDIVVEFLRANTKHKKIRRVSPTSIAKYAGYNDLSKNPLFSKTPSLLEDNILAHKIEAKYANIMSNTFLLGIEPTHEQLNILAMFCMSLWCRSTAFEPIAEEILLTFDKVERQIYDKETLRLTMIIQIFCGVIPFFFRFHRVVGSNLLICSDAPCWPWIQNNNNEFFPFTDPLRDKNLIHSGIASGRYICPLTP
ncbi:MAG: DUF4238 domain-containing protein, partial [Methylomonas sp.]